MVGAAVGFKAIASLLVIVAVECAEVAHVQAHLVADVPSTTTTYAVAVASKRCVLLITVRQTIVSALSTTAYCELVVDVPLYTSQDFVCDMS